jgi:hypothetical protein
MFTEVKFVIQSVQPRIFPHPAAEKITKQIMAMAKVLGADPALADRDAKHVQHVIRAQKGQ